MSSCPSTSYTAAFWDWYPARFSCGWITSWKCWSWWWRWWVTTPSFSTRTPTSWMITARSYLRGNRLPLPPLYVSSFWGHWSRECGLSKCKVAIRESLVITVGEFPSSDGSEDDVCVYYRLLRMCIIIDTQKACRGFKRWFCYLYSIDMNNPGFLTVSIIDGLYWIIFCWGWGAPLCIVG